MGKDFITTRPKLVDKLIKNGISCQRTINPWTDKYSAWIVTLDDKAIKIIKEFYAEIQKPLPRSLMQDNEDDVTIK